jgi:hypothetical protein
MQALARNKRGRGEKATICSNLGARRRRRRVKLSFAVSRTESAQA